MLNKYELIVSGGIDSYLFDGLDYWMMTNDGEENTYCVLTNEDGYDSDLNTNTHNMRTTVFVKEKTAVKGAGTFENPWTFVPVDSQVAYTIKPGITGAFTEVKGYVEYDENITFSININTGYASLPTINCDKSSATVSINSDGSKATITLKEVTEATTCTLDVKRTTVDVKLVVNNGTGSQTKAVNYNTDFVATVAAGTGYTLAGATVSCTNGVSGTLSGNTFTIKNVILETTCTITPKSLAQITLYVNYGTGSTTVYQNFNTAFSTSISANTGYSTSGASVSCTNGQSGYISGSSFKINNVSTSTTCTVTMYRVPYYLTLNGNGGSTWYNYRTIYYGGQYGSLPTPSRSCYTFYGWYTSPSGGTRIYDTSYYYGTSNVTLYAQWSGINSYAGSWYACSYSYISGSYAYGTQYNSCGGSQSCSTYCPYSYNYYDEGTCGNLYNYYSCGYTQYAGYSSCYVAPYCNVYIDNPYPTCARAGDFPFSAWCNVNINSCYWSGCKSGGSGDAWGQDCYPTSCLVGVYPRSTWCNRWNTLTAHLNTVSGSTSCSGSYYPS